MRLVIGVLWFAAAASAQLTISPGAVPGSFRGSNFPSSYSGTGCNITPTGTVLSASGGTAPYTLSLVGGALPPGVSLNSNGTFSGEATAEGAFSFTVRATDAIGQSAQQAYTTTIAPPPSCSLGTRSIGRSLHLPFGCRQDTYTYSSPFGALPPGISIDPMQGVISGIPTTEGSYTFGWRCAGSTFFATLSLNMTVGPIPQTTYTATVGQPFDQTYSLGSGAAPFSYAITQGAPPLGIQLSGNQPRMAGTPATAGRATFRVVRTDANQAIATADFTIDVLQSAPPPATAKPSSISLSAPGQGSGIVASAIALDSGVNASFQATAITDSGGAWLSVTPASGMVTANQTTTLSVRADASALAAGTYVGRIEIQPAGSDLITIPVTLAKARLDKQLQLTQTGVTINVQQSSPPVTRSFFDVLNSGAGTIDWTATASTQSGGDWLQPTMASGTTGQSQSSFGQGAVINPSGLAPGAYYGSIAIAAADAANSPQRATVVLNVTPANVAVTPLVQPQGAVLLGQVGEASSITRFFRVLNTSSAALTFTVSSTTEDGGNWLPSGSGSLLPANGPPTDITSGQQIPVAPGGSVDFGPLVKTDGLARGIYRGLVTLAFSNGTSVNLRIVLVMTPPRSTLTEGGGPGQAGGCTPNETVPVVTELGGGGPPASGWAQPVSVQVVDDCGNPVDSGSAAASYEGLNSPQTQLTNLGGMWSGTWTPPPTDGETPVEVTVTATNEDGVTGESTETVTVQPNELAPPTVAEGGVVQAASFEREPLALGSIVSLFGADLSPLTVESGGAGATSLPLETELGNTRITLGGEPLPLLFVREDQINAILPFELGDRAADELPLVVERTDNQSLSTAQNIVVSAARPGVFTQTGAGTGAGSVLDQNFALVNPENAAAAGETVVVFATGLGPTDPPVATGDAAPAQEPLARATQEVRVTVGGVDAEVLFAGLSPGFAGLFQVNIIVPEGVEAGDAELIVYSGGQPSQITTLAVR